ncbi:MAG: DUF2956 domain-containing protein [Thalassotalea sp.]|nr:DUF2956 domain-containing protein [Thalassotalea sp.]
MPKAKKDPNKTVTPKVAKPSVEVQQAAAKVANGIKKPGQTKEQTKLIEQGIQKGIELYKKQHKAKAREADKAKKKLKNKTNANVGSDLQSAELNNRKSNLLPWLLLIVSWFGFALYLANL